MDTTRSINLGPTIGRPLKVGDRLLDRLEIVECREGGMSYVFIAQEAPLDADGARVHAMSDNGFNICAVKTFRDVYQGSRSAARQFVREAAQWITLPRHRHIVRAYEVTVIAGRPYLLLEYIDGETLRTWIATERLTQARTTQFAIQVCEALAHIYNVGHCLHRDVKPDNVFVTV